jgi:hypothetical protein
MIELFAWLTDTLLYRANLIPERQRLAFLRLLGAPMRPAVPARTIVNISVDDENFKNAVYLQAGALVKGAVNFETLSEITVLPVTGEAYYKRPLTADENGRLADVVQGLHEIYQLEGQTAVPYVTTPVFPQGVQTPMVLTLSNRALTGVYGLRCWRRRKKRWTRSQRRWARASMAVRN